jgi:hypothetical protein
MKPCSRCHNSGIVVYGGRAERCPEPECKAGWLSSDKSERGLRAKLTGLVAPGVWRA